MKRRSTAITLFVAAFALGACGGDSDSTPRSLTLLAYDSFTPSEGIFDAFTSETGKAVDELATGCGFL